MRIKGKGKSILTRQRLPVLGLFEGLLDQVSGAAAAYSIRLLRADYSGGLVRVRAVNSSGVDQGEADVLPDGNNEISLSSELTNRDSTAGSSGRDVSTLGELVTNSSGTDYDGFVSEWKDQSGNANHASNTTASEQPQLVDAGSLIKENGKPAIKYLSNTQHLTANIALTLEDNGFFIVASPEATVNQVDFARIFELQKNRTFLTQNNRSGGIRYEINTFGIFNSGNENIVGKNIIRSVHNKNGWEFYKNGIFKQSSSTAVTSASQDSLTLFNDDGDGNFSNGVLGKHQEFIFYSKDISSEGGKIETNQNNFFKVF